MRWLPRLLCCALSALILGASSIQAAPALPATVAAAAPVPGSIKVLGEFVDHFGYRRKYIQVAKGVPASALVALLRSLHAQEPTTWFWLLDDDSRAAAMLKGLPATERGDTGTYPADWVAAHSVAHIALELRPNQPRRWVAYRGAGSDILVDLGDD